MSHPTKRQFARVVAARQRLMDLRSQRMDQLQRLRAFAKNHLNDFVSTVDPITSVRYCDIQAEGNKTRGDMQVTVAFFEGSKVSVALDPVAKFSWECTPEALLGDVGTLVDVHVSADQTRAQLSFEVEGHARRYVDFGDVLDSLIEIAVRAVEGDIPEPSPQPATVTVLRQPEAVSVLRPAEPALPSAPLPSGALTFKVS
jgi:hypothetical protein